MSKNGLFGHLIDFGGNFSGRPNDIFSFKMHFWGFGVPGLCLRSGCSQSSMQSVFAIITKLPRRFIFKRGLLKSLDDRQITHLICVRLRHFLCDFLWGCFGPFYIRKTTGRRPKTPPPKSHIANGLGLSGTGDSQRDSRESIRANHSQLKPLFL